MARFGLHRTVPPVALLTDFGAKDHYVGVMKGVIHGICPDARVIDLTHSVASQDVTEAAFVLSSVYRYFSSGTIFTCVVDPEVGSERAILCVQANEQVFLAPDNGLLSIVAEERAPRRTYSVENEEYFLEPVSRTFHGRDIFAPVVAHLAGGLDPQKLGPTRDSIRELRVPRPLRTAGGALRGEVIYVDQFGNLITNIGEAILHTAFHLDREQMEVKVGDTTIHGLAESYSGIEPGEALALIGSSNYLEVAVNQGSAARTLGCSRGDPVVLRASSSER